jgi:hypothetical protein
VAAFGAVLAGAALRISVTHNHEALQLFAARGYRQVHWFNGMKLDLTQQLPEVATPLGVAFLGFTPGCSEDARRVPNESFRDHWGSTESGAQAPRTVESFLCSQPHGEVRGTHGCSVGAALFAFGDTIRAQRSGGGRRQRGEPGETPRRSARQDHFGEGLPQGLLVRSPVPAGERIEGAAQTGRRLLIAPTGPFRDRNRRVVPSRRHRAHPDRKQRGRPGSNARGSRGSGTLARAGSSPSADTFPTAAVDEQGDVPRDTDMSEGGATSTAALLIWERRELPNAVVKPLP